MIVGLQFLVQESTTKPAVVLTFEAAIWNSDAVAETQDGTEAPERMLTRSGNSGFPNLRARRLTWITDLFTPAVKLTMTALLGARAVSVNPVRARLWSGKGEAPWVIPGSVSRVRKKASSVFMFV
jgi:hypothetical protein